MTLTVHDIKHHLNLSHDDNSDDELIAYKIAAALNFVETYIGEPAAGYATGTITFGNLAPGATITIGGVIYTGVAEPSDNPLEFVIESSPSRTAENFAKAVEDSEAAYSTRPGWFPTATATGATVILVATDTDAAANSLTMTATSPAVTLSGPTLAGGLTPVPAIAEAVRRIAAHMYENREAVIVGASVGELPLGVWDMLTPYRKWGF